MRAHLRAPTNRAITRSRLRGMHGHLVIARMRTSHMVLSSQGSLCLDILQDKWKPIYTVATILTSVQSLLTDPNTSR